MESSLIFLMMLALFEITSTSSKTLTEEQLRALYESTLDVEEFVNNIFILPASEQLYVYEYLRDLIKNLEKDSKMITFLQASLKLLQQKTDEFNEQHKLEKIPVRKFLQQRMKVQQKASDKKPATETLPRTSSEKPSAIDKPANELQPSSTKNAINSGTDPKLKPKDLKTPPSKLNPEKIPQQKLLHVNSGATAFLKNSAAEKKSLKKSEPESPQPVEKMYPSKKETASKIPSPISKANDERSPPLSSSTQIKQIIQPPLPTNPLNFTLKFDKSEFKHLGKKPSKSIPESSKLAKQPEPSSNTKENSSKPQKIQPSVNSKEPSKKIPSANLAPRVNPTKSKSPQIETKQPKPVELITPAKKPKIQTQSQDEKSSEVKLLGPSNSKSSKLSQASRKVQQASSKAVTEGVLSFSV